MNLKDAIVELKKCQHAAETVLEEAAALEMVTQERDELLAEVEQLHKHHDAHHFNAREAAEAGAGGP